MYKMLVLACVLAVAAAAPAPAPFDYYAPASYSYQSSFVHHPPPVPVVKTYAAHPVVLPVVHPAPIVKTYPTYVHSLPVHPLSYKAPLVYAPHY